MSLDGLDFVTAVSGAATSISNVGPGLGKIIGPNGNFSQLSVISKWILSAGMILGRLELFAILVIISCLLFGENIMIEKKQSWIDSFLVYKDIRMIRILL